MICKIIIIQIIMFIALLNYCTVSVYMCILYLIVYSAHGLFFHKLG